MKQSERAKLQDRVFKMLQKTGVVITPAEKADIEIADCGFKDINRIGLQVLVYENNNRYCAKELILFPRQMCPEHRHPPIDERNIGKQETFRCRWGELFLYVDGEPTQNPKAQVPDEYQKYLTVWKEVILQPGDQITLPPDTKHWFQAGDDGCVISEFSSASIDVEDVFTDPRVRRIPEIEPE